MIGSGFTLKSICAVGRTVGGRGRRRWRSDDGSEGALLFDSSGEGEDSVRGVAVGDGHSGAGGDDCNTETNQISQFTCRRATNRLWVSHCGAVESQNVRVGTDVTLSCWEM